MATVQDYYFNNLSQIRDDDSSVTQRSLQNSGHANHMLKNYRPACPMTSSVEFATSQPSVNFTGSHQVGINGCNVDTNSSVMIGQLSRDKPRVTLQERKYLTVPYLGRGKISTDLESQLIQSEHATQRKSVIASSEKCFIEYRNTPMIPELEESITNPENCVESTHEGWIRGGVPSRELLKDKDYNILE